MLEAFSTFIVFRPPAEPSGGASGQASDIAIHAKEILRVRDSLTKIYQKHCALLDEPVEAGIQRFGQSPLNLSFDTLIRLVESALERDYFLTGKRF